MNYDRVCVLHESDHWVLWRGKHPKTNAGFTIKEAKAGPHRAHEVEKLREEYEFVRQFFKDGSGPTGWLRPAEPDLEGGRFLYEDAQCTLGQLIQQEGTLPLDAANVLRQVAEALKALHQQKCGHGALSSHSVVVSPDGTARLGPFCGYKFAPTGPARPPAPDPHARYQAPEFFHNPPAPEPSSDLYCLGFLIVEMLAGSMFNGLFGFPPESAPQPPEFIAWHTHPDPKKRLPALHKDLRDVPESLLDILQALTKKDKTERQRGYKTTDELLKALQDFKLGSKRALPRYGAAPPPPPPPPPEEVEEPREPVLIAAPRVQPGPLVLTTRTSRGGQRVEFLGPTAVVIGSDGTCDLCVAGDDIDERHALLVCQGREWWVYDLRSEGGTYRNEQRVRQHFLANGDQLRVGSRTFQVEVQSPPRGSGGGAVGATAPGPGVTIRSKRGRLVFGELRHTGRQGQLYQALWETNSGACTSAAVRVFTPEFARNPAEISRFIRGCELAGPAWHPNLVKLLTGGKVKMGNTRWWYLAMEYLHGGSLRDKLQSDRQPLSVARVVQCGLEVCAVLAEAGSKGLLHRNINPSCVLFNDQGAAKLGDFALLRPEELTTMYNITRTGIVIGEQIYQAPEVVAGKPTTAAADVYGLAATLYEAVTNRPPVARVENDLYEQLRRIQKEVPPPADSVRKGVPAELVRALARGLAKSPEDRYTSAAEFALALRTVPV